MDGVHGDRRQSDADAAAAVCEQRLRLIDVDLHAHRPWLPLRDMHSCTILYDIWPPRYRMLDESAIDIAISCNRYDH